MWIQISSGKGPEECERGCFLFYKKFRSFCERNNIYIKELNIANGGKNNTIKSVLISVKNLNEEKKIEIESFEGTIKWISISPFRKKHKRKNWFIKFEIFEETVSEYSKEELFSMKDVIIKATRASGKGGQHVNKTDSAIQITHLPTKISFKVKEERSQIMNKKLAIAKLSKALLELNNSKKVNMDNSLWSSNNQLIRGNPTKTYKGEDFKL